MYLLRVCRASNKWPALTTNLGVSDLAPVAPVAVAVPIAITAIERRLRVSGLPPAAAVAAVAAAAAGFGDERFGHRREMATATAHMSLRAGHYLRPL